MDILFIHGNYPGQFRHLAPLLANNGKHRVKFITGKEELDNTTSNNIEIHQFKKHRSISKDIHHYVTETEDSVINGQAVMREINKIMQDGFNPKVVINHAGMGLGLFIKDLIPKCTQIGYLEWYFLPKTTKHLVEEFDLDMQLKAKMRNASILLELQSCDRIVVPTKWQKKQFPKEYGEKIDVIFDGIDQRYFHAQDISDEHKDINIVTDEKKLVIAKEWKVLTYMTRGMEPLRGFPEFMRALPHLLKLNSDLRVYIAGKDRQAYSYPAPKKGGSWKKYLMDEMGNIEGKERIIFTGLLSYCDYRKLLWRTNLHCYFTKPYVTSWSYFEAAACRTVMAVNKNEATIDIADENSINWVDLDDKQKLQTQLNEILNKRNPKKAKLLDEHLLAESLRGWERTINNAINNNNQ